jgi:glycosyltransferase involved in cell wall biosynthesis
VASLAASQVAVQTVRSFRLPVNPPSPSIPQRDGTPVVALIPWGLSIEDFLEPNGLTLETFCSEFRGSWMFGYIDALRSAGVRTLLVCLSRSVRKPSRLVHLPTGAPVLALPVPRRYQALRRLMADPYGRTTRQTFGGYRGLVGWPVLAPLKELAPYLATPVRPLLRELRREGIDAVLCQEYEFPRFDICALAGKIRGLRVFAVFQGGDYRRWQVERLTRPVAVRMCDGLIIGAIGEVDRVRSLYGLPDGKLARIPNPVDVQLWRPTDRRAARSLLGLPDEARIAVWHGRVQLPKKGLDVLLEAWVAICRDSDPRDLRLVLVGDGEHAAAVVDLIAQSGLDNIVFVNQLLHDPAQLRTYLAAADVFVFPSRHEGLAVAPIEAMACGLPIVATDSGGIRDIVGEGEGSGGVVVPREDAAALAEAVGSLLHDEALRRLLGEHARRRAVEEFSLEAVGQRLRSFLLDRPRATGRP